MDGGIRDPTCRHSTGKDATAQGSERNTQRDGKRTQERTRLEHQWRGCSGHVVAVGTLQPTPSLPGVPTMSESGLPGFQSESWFGLVGPAGMPRAHVAQLNRDVVKILAAPEIKERFMRGGALAVYGTSEEFKQLMQADYARYIKLVKDAGISSQ